MVMRERNASSLHGISVLVTQTSSAGKPGVALRNVSCFFLLFFFSLFNVKNNFDTQLQYVYFSDSVKQAINTRQKSELE